MGARVQASEVTQQRVRARIVDLVSQSPGVHLRKIARILAIPLGTAKYHTSMLERRGAISRMRVGNRVHFFLPSTPRAGRPAWIAQHGPPSRARLLALLQDRPGFTQQEAMETLGLSRSTVREHLRHLEAHDLVRHTGPRRGMRYYPTIIAHSRGDALRARMAGRAQEAS